MIACEKESQVQRHETTKQETSQETSMLSFTSEAEMFKQIHELKLMTEESRSAWNKQHNFVSQSEFQWQIVDELNGASSMEEIRQIQAKYNKTMLFNTNPADEDISPYIPSDVRGSEYVCNKDGDVLIGGKIVNYNTLTSYEQTRAYRFLNQYKTRARNIISGAYAEANKRKFWVEAVHNTNNGWIELEFTAHAKNVFGWNKYQTSYFVKIVEFVNWGAVTNFTTDLLSAGRNFFETAELPSGSYFPFVAGRSNPNAQARFYIHCFSRGVGAENVQGFGVLNSPTPLSKAIDGYVELGF